jgi:hypothetical protein
MNGQSAGIASQAQALFRTNPLARRHGWLCGGTGVLEERNAQPRGHGKRFDGLALGALPLAGQVESTFKVAVSSQE